MSFGKNEKGNAGGGGDPSALQVGKNVLHQEDLQFDVTYNGEVFTLRYPTPHTQSFIEVEIARRLDGLPRNSFSEEQLIRIEAYAYVNSLLVPEKSPSWFKSAWTCMDEDLIFALYKAYIEFKETFRRRLREGEFSTVN